MITPLYAGILGIIYLSLTFFTIKGRFKHGVALGSGGNEEMEKSIRMHANFAEYVPIALLLLLMCETVNTVPIMIHAMGVLLIIGRLLHAFGLMSANSVNKKRQVGMVLTLGVILAASTASIGGYF
jgi:uncharacterized membrane protein YecN with MAPEG domain